MAAPPLSKEELARKIIKRALSGKAPAETLPLVIIENVEQVVELPWMSRKTQICRLAAEGTLTLGWEWSMDGDEILVAGTAEWGWLWRFSRKRDWVYLKNVVKSYKRSKGYDSVATRDFGGKGV